MIGNDDQYKAKKSILIYAPVYKKGLARETEEERLENIEGLISIKMSLDSIVSKVYESFKFSAGIDIEVSDVTDANNPVSLYSSAVFDSNLRYSKTIKVANRKWEITSYNAQGYFQTGWHRSSVLIMVLGLIISTTLVLYLLINRHKDNLLNVSRDKLSLLADSIPAMINYIDEDYKYVYTNKQYESFWGIEKDSLIGKTPKEILESDVLKRVLSNLNKALSGENVSYTEWVTAKDNQLKYLKVTHTPDIARNGKVRGVFSLIEDLTELQTLNDALADREENLNLITNNVPALIAHVDDRRRFTYVNQRYADFVNKEVSEIVGEKVEDILGKDLYKKIQAEIDAVLKGEERVFEMHISAINKQEKWTKASYIPETNEDGKVTGFYGLIIDVTDQKQAEIQLNQAIEELTKSNSALERFAYVASHDLREPLRASSICSTRLLSEHKDSLDESGKELLNQLTNKTSQMAGLVEDLLKYSRMAGDDSVFADTDCNEILTNVLEILEALAEEESAEVTFEELPSVWGDGTQITQILQNLIANGIKYNSKKKKKIHISAEEVGNEWVFAVKDNGIGIEKEYYDEIFLPFRRLDKKLNSSGTGMGLAICKQVAENHKGRIWVESDSKKGTTFYFTIASAAKQKKVA